METTFLNEALYNSAFINIAIYISVNFFLFYSWYFFLFKKKDYLSFTERLIGTFILSLTQIIFTEMLLGVVFKKLYAMPLFLLNISISSGVLILALKQNQRIVPRMQTTLILQEFKNKIDWFFSVIKGDLVLLCIFGLFLISVCWMIFLGYLFPSYVWDALWYHLPMVGYIIQNGAIQENPTPLLIGSINTLNTLDALPKIIELFFLWNTIFLKSDIIVDLSQLPFSIAGVLTIYSMGIKLRIKREHAIYSSFLFFFTPIVILQSTTNYVDIAVSVLFLIAINFLMYDEPKNYTNNEAGLIQLRVRKIPILLSGLTTGILLGSKGSGPLFFVVLSAMFIFNEFVRRMSPFGIVSSEHKKFSVKTIPPHLKRDRGDYQGKSSFVLYLVYFIVPAALMGGYWYIKNWVLYGNPVYPFKVSFLNTTLFRGLYEGIIEPLPSVLNDISRLIRPFYVWREKVEYYLYDSRLGGFGPIWFILFLPSSVFSFVYAVRNKKYNFLFVSTILVVTFLIYPMNWNTRYVIFIVGLGALSFGLVIDYFKKRENVLKIIALLLAGYTFFTANSPCIMSSKIKEFLDLPAKERTIARHAPFNIDLQARQDYGLWIWINNNMSKGDTLAYTFEPLFLRPLWNRDFSNKVLYIKSENFNEWIESLKNNRATYVLIKQNSIEDKKIQEFKRLVYNTPSWLGVSKNLAERFKVVYSDENYKVLRFGY